MSIDKRLPIGGYTVALNQWTHAWFVDVLDANGLLVVCGPADDYAATSAFAEALTGLVTNEVSVIEIATGADCPRELSDSRATIITIPRFDRVASAMQAMACIASARVPDVVLSLTVSDDTITIDDLCWNSRSPLHPDVLALMGEAAVTGIPLT